MVPPRAQRATQGVEPWRVWRASRGALETQTARPWGEFAVGTWQMSTGRRHGTHDDCKSHAYMILRGAQREKCRW